MNKRCQHLEERMRVAMRTAIREHPKAKLWAKANSEDHFCLAISSTAHDATMDEVCLDIFGDKGLVCDVAYSWLNEHSSDVAMKAFLLTTCREMYKVLRV
jgi:hypothetical protein